MKATCLTLALILFHTLIAHAWHDLGHETVAAIAWDKMTPQARNKAVALLQSAPPNSGLRALRPHTGTEAEKDRWHFIRAAVWADDVRSGPREHTYHQGQWHYTDYFWEQSALGARGSLRDDKAPYGDMVTKLPQLEASLRDPGNSHVSPSKSTDLAWFIHLMGDIGQPLHCSGRISPGFPDGDQGGNLFCLRRNQVGKCTLNLHSYWDHVIEREYGSNANVVEIANNLENSYRPSPFTRLRLGEYSQWVSTGRTTAMRVAYPSELRVDQEPPAHYRDLVKQVSLKVITLAGFRLGATLNKVLDPH